MTTATIPAGSPAPGAPTGTSEATPSSVLQVCDLRTSFGAGSNRVDAVRGVDLQLRPGEVTVLLGESGSGKSVTGKSLLRLYGSNATTTGRVVLDGIDLLTLDAKQMLAVRGAELAMVPQDPAGALDPLRRVGRQLVEVLRHHRMVDGKAPAESRALELLEAVGIPDPPRVFRSFPHELSGGMKQRVVIAIALSCQPKVLVADEPTTALDVTVQAQILELFDDLVRQVGAAVLLVTHDVGVAAQVGNFVGVMYAGRVVEYGPAAQVLEAPRHPYTRALLESAPVPGMARGTLRSIPGQPPVSGEVVPGCAFAPRCGSAMASCHGHEPPLVVIRGGRQAACPVENPSPGGVR